MGRMLLAAPANRRSVTLLVFRARHPRLLSLGRAFDLYMAGCGGTFRTLSGNPCGPDPVVRGPAVSGSLRKD